jgi:hypothetical protein
MYTQIWKKYLPVIRILVKRSAEEEQRFQLNVPDFEKVGQSRKASPRFTITFNKGRADNSSRLPAMAKELSDVLLQDAALNELFQQNTYMVSMTTKYTLAIKSIPKEASETEPPVDAMAE